MDADGTREEEEERRPRPQPHPQLPVLRKSCDYCARMKRACDGGSPCALCRRRGKTCERRLRRKSGPAKGAKYAPRRRKLNDEVALTEEEAVAATRARQCAAGNGNGTGTGTGANEDPPDRRSHGVVCSTGRAMPAAAAAAARQSGEEEDEKQEAEASSTTTQPQPQPQRRRLWGGGGEQWAEDGTQRDSRCSNSSGATSSATSAARFFPAASASSHDGGGLRLKREFLYQGSVEAAAAAAAASRGGGEGYSASPGRDHRARCGSVEGRPPSAGGGGGGGTSTPSSPPSLGPRPPSAACTSYSSRGAIGRVVPVQASPLKGAGVGVGERGYWQTRAGEGEGSCTSRIQAIEPSVRASGEGFNFRPLREGPTAEQRSPHMGGSGSQQSPQREQQPLAPRDLLLMLRPDDEGAIDIIADSDEQRSSAAPMAAVTAANGGGGGDNTDRRCSWSDDSSRAACAEAGELLRGFRRDSVTSNATAAAAAAAATAVAAAAAEDRPDTSGPAPAGPGHRDRIDLAERWPWLAGRGRPLPAGRGGGGAGFAFGDKVLVGVGGQPHRGADGWPTLATVTDSFHVRGGSGGSYGSSSAEYGRGHGSYTGGDGSGALPPHCYAPRGGDGGGGPMWRYDGNHVLVGSFPTPARAAAVPGMHRRRHLSGGATHLQPRSRFTPRYFPGHEVYQPEHARLAYMRHPSLTDGLEEEGGGGGGIGGGVGGGAGVGAGGTLLGSSGAWTTAPGQNRNPAVTFTQVIPADAISLPRPAAGAGAGGDGRGGGRGSGGSGSGHGGKAGVAAAAAGGGFWSGGNWSAVREPAPTDDADTDARFSRGGGGAKVGGDEEGGRWRVISSDGPFRKRGKMARS